MFLTPFVIDFEYGGCNKSQNCSRASRKGLDTCVEVVVVHSTRYGYNAMSCSHAVLSSVKTRL